AQVEALVVTSHDVEERRESAVVVEATLVLRLSVSFRADRRRIAAWFLPFGRRRARRIVRARAPLGVAHRLGTHGGGTREFTRAKSSDTWNATRHGDDAPILFDSSEIESEASERFPVGR